MSDEQRQVVIYLDDPAGQLIQTTLSDYRGYWRGIGWKILDRPPELDLDLAPVPNQQECMI